MKIITISMTPAMMISSANHLLSTNILSVTTMIALGSKVSLRSPNNSLPVNTKSPTAEKDSRPSKKPMNPNIFNSITISKTTKKSSTVLIKFKKTGLLPSPSIS